MDFLKIEMRGATDSALINRSVGGVAHNIKEALIYSSFRAQRSGDPESSVFSSTTYWIPACAGMTDMELIRVSLTASVKCISKMPSFPRRRESSLIKKLDPRLRGDDKFRIYRGAQNVAGAPKLLRSLIRLHEVSFGTTPYYSVSIVRQ